MSDRLVLIDGDDIERVRVARILEEGGFEVVSVREALSGLLVIIDARPQCVLLAEELAPLRAPDILRIVRRITNSSIAILGRGDESDEIECLENGADDYIRQPVGRPLLLARISSLIRRTRNDDTPKDGARVRDRSTPSAADFETVKPDEPGRRPHRGDKRLTDRTA